MSFFSTVLATFALIFVDIFFSSIRPTWVDGEPIASYILMGAHVLVIILEGITVFILFSGTVWFAAGLLGHLFFSVRPTLPFWILRIILVALPWAYKSFVASTGNGKTAWDDGVYGFLFVADIISCIGLSSSLCYTLCCLTDKHMYAPYHTDINMEERAMVQQINAGTGGGAGDILGADGMTIHGDGGQRHVRFASVISANSDRHSVSGTSYPSTPRLTTPSLHRGGAGGGDANPMNVGADHHPQQQQQQPQPLRSWQAPPPPSPGTALLQGVTSHNASFNNAHSLLVENQSMFYDASRGGFVAR